MEQQLKPTAIFLGPVQTRSGYGERARDIANAIIESELFDVRFVPGVRWGATPFIDISSTHSAIHSRLLPQPKIDYKPYVFFQHSVPNEFFKAGYINVGITAGIEATKLSQQIVDGCNKMDLLLVSSEFVKQTFIDNGVTVPIEVIFEGVNTSVFKQLNLCPTNVRRTVGAIPETFAFLFVGHWLPGNLGDDRKDIGNLISLFMQVFRNAPNPPALILKTSSGALSTTDRNNLLERIESIRSSVGGPKVNVYIIYGDLTDDEMNALYNHPKIKAFVSFTHGEGWNRPYLEASLTGKPVMLPGWSGHVDYLKHYVQLPHKMSPVSPHAFPQEYVGADAEWCTIDYKAAADLLHKVFTDYDSQCRAVRGQDTYVLQNFTLDKMKALLSLTLQKYKTNILPNDISLQLPFNNVDLILASSRRPK
jgi:hypothetical protein